MVWRVILIWLLGAGSFPGISYNSQGLALTSPAGTFGCTYGFKPAFAPVTATTLNYDNQGNLTSIAYPDGSSWTYQYDLAGRMNYAADGSGRAMQIAYNNQGLPTNITSAAGVLRRTIYDAVNRPVSVTDANGITLTNQYDLINELLQRTWPDGIGESFGYSPAGLIAYTNRDGHKGVS